MDFLITIDDTSKSSLHCQIYNEIRQAILSGRLRPDQKIPSTRMLANSLGVARATVVISYEQLLSEGYLKTIPGAGTFVSDQLPEQLLQSTATPISNSPKYLPVQLSTYGQALMGSELCVSTKPKLPSSIDFSCYGKPAFDQFPSKLWRQLLSRYCQFNQETLDYPNNPLGYKPLREAIASYLTQARAVKCETDQVVIVSGSQQAFSLTSQILIEPGDSIAIEDPGYLDAQQIFQTRGAKLLPIPTDTSGMKVEHLIRNPNMKVKLVCVTPSHQFPTGTVLSLPKRLALLSWAEKVGSLLLEDDYDSEFRYTDRPIPALQGLARNNSVIYMGTFSKVLFPSLRIGYIVPPKNLVDLFAKAKWLTDRQSPLLEQQALTEFIQAGHLERHIRKMRLLYDQRRQALVQALKQYLGDRAVIMGENAGMHVMVRLKTQMSDGLFIDQAIKSGVNLTSTQPFYLSTERPSGEFILGYSHLATEEIDKGIHRLAQLLESWGALLH